MPYVKTGKKIEKIEPLKNGKIRLSFANGAITISKDVYTSHYLYQGKEIEGREYYSLIKESELDSLYQYAKRIAIKGAYSSYEIKGKLYKKDEKNYLKVFDRLVRECLIDDSEYAKEYFEEKLKRGYGEERIKNELSVLKHVDQKIIDKLKTDGLTRVSAVSLIPLYEKKYASLPLEAKKQKTKMALIRRGFSISEIEMALPKLRVIKLKEEKEMIAKDVLKYHRLYKRKYNGRDLYIRMRTALSKKGYTNSAIEKAMEEYEDGFN